jgi:hypothetical protein
MGQATVQVKYVNPPKQGKVNGSIKDSNGEMFGVPPALLSTFQEGATYDLEYNERVFKGQTYKTISSAKLISAGDGMGSSKYGNKDAATAERIFVCGALNAAIQGGHVELSDVTLSNVVNILRSVWSHTLGVPADKTDDMNGDQVPF